MKITKNLTHVVSSVDFQAALNEKELANVLGEKGMQGKMDHETCCGA